MRTSRVPRPAALVLGLGLLVGGSVAAPAALAAGQPADDVPDLTISTNAYNSIYPGLPCDVDHHTRQPRLSSWDPNCIATTPAVPRLQCRGQGRAANLFQVVAASGDSGFSCSQAERRGDMLGWLAPDRRHGPHHDQFDRADFRELVHQHRDR